MEPPDNEPVTDSLDCEVIVLTEKTAVTDNTVRPMRENLRKHVSPTRPEPPSPPPADSAR